MMMMTTSQTVVTRTNITGDVVVDVVTAVVAVVLERTLLSV
jgi:VanZ family protein